MDVNDVDREFEAIRVRLACDDPHFVRRVRRMRRRETVHTIVVFALLAVGAVMLTVGLATISFVVWSLGIAALVGAVAVDAAMTPAGGDRRCG